MRSEEIEKRSEEKRRKREERRNDRFISLQEAHQSTPEKLSITHEVPKTP